MKVKKDRMFVIVMGLILTNLVWWLAAYLSRIRENLANIVFWAFMIVDVFAIIGVLWLLRTYRKGRIEAKKDENIE